MTETLFLIDALRLIPMMFKYEFMITALIVGVMIAISSASLGSFLVLKRFSMIGHGLAHVAFGAVAIGLLTSNSPLLVAMPIVIIVAILILKLNEKANVYGDAAIGLAATTAMALGTIIASVSGGFRLELNSYLFGSILTIQSIDVYLAISSSVVIISLVTLFYQDLFSLTYDEAFAKVSGIRTERLTTLLAVLTGLTVVIGIRVLGTILMSSFIVFPTIIALQFKKGFKKTMIIAIIVSIVTVFIGLTGSFIFDLPSGSAIVMFNAILFTVIYIIKMMFRSKN
jgi:zinc transport system permease protein